MNWPLVSRVGLPSLCGGEAPTDHTDPVGVEWMDGFATTTNKMGQMERNNFPKLINEVIKLPHFYPAFMLHQVSISLLFNDDSPLMVSQCGCEPKPKIALIPPFHLHLSKTTWAIESQRGSH